MTVDEPDLETCGVCGYSLSEGEPRMVITNRLTGARYDVICETHDATDVLGEMLIVDGRI